MGVGHHGPFSTAVICEAQRRLLISANPASEVFYPCEELEAGPR